MIKSEENNFVVGFSNSYFELPQKIGKINYFGIKRNVSSLQQNC